MKNYGALISDVEASASSFGPKLLTFSTAITPPSSPFTAHTTGLLPFPFATPAATAAATPCAAAPPTAAAASASFTAGAASPASASGGVDFAASNAATATTARSSTRMATVKCKPSSTSLRFATSSTTNLCAFLRDITSRDSA
eukprot:CAMPEP_0184725250 /NCGR_PEP_ID=MMETSP0314-20130426/30403_1 /TAXON_ID=38298 /ORGANISM="Rhodella maculata, Strain CCMP 736" /LENGTH=142 /DNA_ID=CAMNT_0027190425 /DNA_START=67 /DNA_END=492 /DNA_ORIENTATION=+